MKNKFYPLDIFLYSVIFFFCLTAAMRTGFLGADLWPQLIMGKHIFETGTVLSHDMTSFTPPAAHVWFDCEWLCGVLFWSVATFFGGFGLIFLKGLLIFLIIFLSNFCIRLKSRKQNFKYKIPYTLIFLFCFLFLSGQFKTLCCQDFSLLFIILTYICLEKQRLNYSSKIIYFLPFLMLFWLNIHSGSLLGLGIIFIYGLGEFLNKKPFKKYFLILIICSLVYFINPWGVDFIKFMFDSLFLERTWIDEWKSPFMFAQAHSLNYFIAFLCIIFVYFYNLFKTKTPDYTKTLILLSGLIFTLKYSKFATIFFISAYIFMYCDFKNIFDDIFKIASKFCKKKIPFGEIFLIFLIIYTSFNFFTCPKNYWHKRTIEKYPINCLQFLSENNIKGKIFAPYFYNGFITYKNYPDLKIYMDDKQEQVYDYDVFEKHMHFLYAVDESSFNILKFYQPDIIILDKYWPCNDYLSKNPDFVKVFTDPKYVLYLSNKLLQNTYKIPNNFSFYGVDRIFETKIKFK